MNIELSTISSKELPGVIEKLCLVSENLKFKIAETEVAKCVHFVHFTPQVERQIFFAEQALTAFDHQLTFVVRLLEKGSSGVREAMKILAQPIDVESFEGVIAFRSLLELANNLEALLTQPFFHRTICWF